MKNYCGKLIAKSVKAQRCAAKTQSIMDFIAIHDFAVLSGTLLLCTAYICITALLVRWCVL